MSPVRDHTVDQQSGPDMQEAVARSPQAEMPARGPQTGAALQAAQSATKSNLNQTGSASGYSRLADAYNDQRKLSNFTNKFSGVMVAGASLTPRIERGDSERTGQVVFQTSETYVAKYMMAKSEDERGEPENGHLRIQVGKLLGKARAGDIAARGEALVLAVDTPMSRALHAANPELSPAMVRQHEATRAAREFVGMNRVAPLGDPATGRPVFQQAWMVGEGGGQVPVVGFRKKVGGQNEYLGTLPGVDENGDRTLSLVDRVDFTPGVNANQTRHIIREPHILAVHNIETLEAQRELMEKLESKGWKPITQAPPEQADLPAKFRGLSEVNVSARATLKMADAVAKHDVINKGLAFAQTGDRSLMEGLPNFEQGLVDDFARQAQVMMSREGAGLAPKAVERLYGEMDVCMRKLGDLSTTVTALRRDPAAMDPITEYRKIATRLLKTSGAKVDDLYRVFDNPEESFKRSVSPDAHRDYAAADNLRKAVLEQMAKDLTDVLGAWPKERGEQWKDPSGKALTFPDGTARYATPFDSALARGGAHYDVVREKYFDLLQSCMNCSASLESVQLIMASRTKTADNEAISMQPQEASRLAQDHTNALITGKAMKPAEAALFQRVMAKAGPTNQYLDEIKRLYAFSPLVAAHRAGFSPAEFQRAMVANAKDNEPWDVSVKSYKVYDYDSVPVPSGPAVYIAPEQELPKGYDPTDPEMVKQVADSRTWRVIRLIDEEGRPTPDSEEMGLSTAQMIDYRLEAATKHLPVAVSRMPLPVNMPLAQGLARTFNMPILTGADPIDGTPGKYATTGMRVTGTPVATTVNPNYYKAINFGKAFVVEKKEPVQMMDEAHFASTIGIARAKAAVETTMKGNPEQAAILKALDRMTQPTRERGVYVVTMDEAGLKAFEADRIATIQAMTAARIAVAEHSFNGMAASLPPDARGAKETERNDLTRQARADGEAKMRELSVVVKNMAVFMKANAGRQGYTGFAPALGVGNPAVRIHKPPFELRFPGGTGIEEMRARLNKCGLNVDLDQFQVPEDTN